MNTPVAIEILPVIEDDYYKMIVYDIEVDGGCQVKMVREIFHSDNLAMAIELLHQLSTEGLLIDSI